MPGTSTETFGWETVTGPKGEKARLGNVTYFVDVVTRSALGGFAALVIVRGWGGRARLFKLGDFTTLENAKEACERHYADGCDVSVAKPYVIKGVGQP
jgi:hypothetical protein